MKTETVNFFLFEKIKLFSKVVITLDSLTTIRYYICGILVIYKNINFNELD